MQNPLVSKKVLTSKKNTEVWGIQTQMFLLKKKFYFVLGYNPLMGFPCGAAAAAKSIQSCPTLCDPIDGSPPGSPVPGILQARTLEWVAISFSDA